jgi:hypothetical protein
LASIIGLYVGYPHTIDERPGWDPLFGGHIVSGPALGYLFAIVFGVVLVLSGARELRHRRRNRQLHDR